MTLFVLFSSHGGKHGRGDGGGAPLPVGGGGAGGGGGGGQRGQRRLPPVPPRRPRASRAAAASTRYDCGCVKSWQSGGVLSDLLHLQHAP